MRFQTSFSLEEVERYANDADGRALLTQRAELGRLAEHREQCENSGQDCWAARQSLKEEESK
jgi:hypothetical protein